VLSTSELLVTGARTVVTELLQLGSHAMCAHGWTARAAAYSLPCSLHLLITASSSLHSLPEQANLDRKNQLPVSLLATLDLVSQSRHASILFDVHVLRSQLYCGGRPICLGWDGLNLSDGDFRQVGVRLSHSPGRKKKCPCGAYLRSILLWCRSLTRGAAGCSCCCPSGQRSPAIALSLVFDGISSLVGACDCHCGCRKITERHVRNVSG
jgi:hypothetical protein